MSTLADLHRAVQTTLASKRLGTPVFARYQYHAAIKGQAAIARLAKTTATVRACSISLWNASMPRVRPRAGTSLCSWNFALA
jgi:hypothetical protein